MESSTDSIGPVSSGHIGEEEVYASEWAVPMGGGSVWLPDAILVRQCACGHKGVRAVGVFLKHGEARAVDGQRGDQFEIALNTSPVTRQWATTQLCDPLVSYASYERPRDPDAMRILTCVDHCDGQPCVVVVLDGWDDAEALVRVARAKGQLANPEG